VLAIARSQGFSAFALSVHYGQRHSAELEAARRVANALGAHEHRVMGVDLAGIGGSALTDTAVAVPETQHHRYPGHLCAGAQYADAVAGAGLG
jgi:7-cyano-7-deazaguanine synthase